MRKYLLQSLFSLFMLFCLLTSLSSFTYAGTITLTTTGEYAMGDKDTAMDGKALALENAKRNILEQVGTYVESTTEVKNGVIKSDTVKQYTAGIVKIEAIKEERRLLENKAVLIIVSVKAAVDPDAIVKQVMALKNRSDVEEKATKLSSENIRLRNEITLLNQQLKQISNDNQRQELMTQRRNALQKINENANSLTMLVSGASLVKMSLLNRQKKQEDFSIIQNFLQEIADAYKISLEEPQIDDNGDGTSNVTVNYSISLPGNYDNRNDVSIYVPTLRNFLSQGFIIKGFLDGGLIIRCEDTKRNYSRCQSVLRPYFDEEVKNVSVIINIGNRVKTQSLRRRAGAGRAWEKSLEGRGDRRGDSYSNNSYSNNYPSNYSSSYSSRYSRSYSGGSSGSSSGSYVPQYINYPLIYKASHSYTFENIPHDELRMVSSIGIKVLYDR